MNERTIISAFFPINDLKSTIRDFVHEHFKYYPQTANLQINKLIKVLRLDLNCYIEYPYVDKVYRNSYYNFYSTKHNQTLRDCARVSFFSNSIGENHFLDNRLLDELEKEYLGFITIRPTLPNIIGRSMISPIAYKENNWIGCYTDSNVVINGVRLKTKAFPHSSQDGETITCAETTIWAVMEYFGTKYSEYKPVLPSKIIETLSDLCFERQLPSRGLTAEQISYAIKEFGFGTRLYSQRVDQEDIYSKDEFRRLLGYYNESGIPIIAAIENKNIGHAFVIIGHKDINHSKIDLLHYKPIKVNKKNGQTLDLYDYVDFISEYIVIDDNMPPYNIISFDEPTKNYNDVLFKGCEIKNFIAPLYHKIYLEAGGAKELVISYLESFDHDLPGTDIIFKLFYTSSRSFKAELRDKMNLGKEATEIILNSTMPKFIWLCILTNNELIKESKANGMVIFDATEPNYEDSTILMISPNGVTTYNPHEEPNNKYNEIDVKTNSFNIFANNLKKVL